LDRGGVKSAIGLGALADGSVYLYKVIGFNSANVRSSASDAAIARTKYRPAAPAGLTATTNMPLSISLAWRPNPEKDIREYVVECSYFPDESFRKLVVVPANRVGGLSATEMALGSGVVRYSRVKAVDQDGLESEWSKVVLGRAKPVPDAPANLGRESVGGNVRVSWRAPGQPDVQRYTVWRRKFVGWEAIATTDQTSYMFEFAEGAKPMTIAVSAVDKDGLDGEKSVPIEVKPGL
jgi:fibronectin type 3 domain-containing protein